MLPEIREKRIPLCTGSSGCGHQLNVGGYAGFQTLMLGKIAGRRRKGQQRMRWLAGISISMDMSVSRLQERTEKAGMLQSVELQRVGHDLGTK